MQGAGGEAGAEFARCAGLWWWALGVHDWTAEVWACGEWA